MVEELRRFFVDPALLKARNVTVEGDLAHRLARVLRYRRGDKVVLTGGGAKEYVVELKDISQFAVHGVIEGERPAPPEPSVAVVLYQSLIRNNRFDLALEKCTEIGVARFVPVVAERTQGQFDEPAAGRSERWQRIVVEAAEQCGRGKLPVIDPPLTFVEALRTARGTKIVPWEAERTQKLGEYLRSLSRKPETVSVFIGPEGGYDASEVEAARDAGAALVTLGRQVMRAETAAVVACGILLHELDG